MPAQPSGSPLLGAAAAALCGLAWLLAGCGPPTPLPVHVPTASPGTRHAGPAPSSAVAADVGVPGEIGSFERHALNAFVATLLDDAEPPHWAAPSVEFGCGDTAAISVDGAPLQPGAPLPMSPFRLRWELQGCRPFGHEGPELSGIVDLQVYRDDEALAAWVTPHAVRFEHNGRGRMLDTPFTARLLLRAPVPASRREPRP